MLLDDLKDHFAHAELLFVVLEYALDGFHELCVVGPQHLLGQHARHLGHQDRLSHHHIQRRGAWHGVGDSPDPAEHQGDEADLAPEPLQPLPLGNPKPKRRSLPRNEKKMRKLMTKRKRKRKEEKETKRDVSVGTCRGGHERAEQRCDKAQAE
jgi:hypothetical protein